MLILASKSQTRKTLLDNAGIAFSARPAAVDERSIEQEVSTSGADKKEVAGALALAKAQAVSAANPAAVVIGADQTLECGDLEVHKPSTRADAEAQLRAMAGRPHQLHAGVALVKDGVRLWQHVETATLLIKNFTDAELETVLDLEGDSIFSSVGGYRLEGPSVRLFASISGDYFTILGLPLLPLIAALAQFAPETLKPGAA
ncbi:Maf family protein [Pelagibacterium xiamenense]|uniref:Maf family protein n=1 Tax=Pelagibacterium xiamenense TaxID=2901140 RepID=UPI001E58E2F5|nr:Maf family protein [Pelagibacterium xiamenense]MCD7058428.1 Maf family protein [Pelagibacterium xiamenense]